MARTSDGPETISALAETLSVSAGRSHAGLDAPSLCSPAFDLSCSFDIQIHLVNWFENDLGCKRLGTVSSGFGPPMHVVMSRVSC